MTLHGCVTDVPGVRVGHTHRVGRGWRTGTTVVLFPEATVGSVDVRGGGPGTRETDLLHPTATMPVVHAVCLTGGSAYGLAAAGGVMEFLEQRGVGFAVGTGFALVDAGMRELWRTGSMHNRVRMVAASFLIKNLLIDWRAGEQWFWDTLVDADSASNPFGWQWVAGSGADAAPYFRVFNPELQAKKFDPNEQYIRQNIEEWATDAYPAPIVDLGETRRAALAAYAAIKRPTA